jgi:D-3-phosphoglycerate dehydrogenase
MKVLANDGISKAGEQALKEAGIEILDNRVAQDHVINLSTIIMWMFFL